jgi:ADP-ribosylglycohydrolase
MNEQRAMGCLLGLATGDALGATLEFSDPENVPDFPELMTGPLKEIIGEGPHGLVPGQTTDDTQMAVVLAQTLMQCKIMMPDKLFENYQAWLRISLDSGRLTRQSLLGAGRTTGRKLPKSSQAVEAWEKSNRQSAGNGSLMRCAPLAVWWCSDMKNVWQSSLMDSEITHVDPRCQLACAAFNCAVAHALVTANATPESMTQAAEKGLNDATVYMWQHRPLWQDEINAAHKMLHNDLVMAREKDPQLYDVNAALGVGNVTDLTKEELAELNELDGLSIIGATMGYVRVAFRLAFWYLHHVASFEAALIDCVNRGGDSDTNGAIAGALLGSLYGMNAVPQRWRDLVLSAQPGGSHGPLTVKYHPKYLVSLVKQWFKEP